MDNYFLNQMNTFLQIKKEEISKHNNPNFIVWAMDEGCNYNDQPLELIIVIKKHLRELFPDWKEIFEFQTKTRLNSLELSEQTINILRNAYGYLYLEEILLQKQNIDSLEISLADKNRLKLFLKSSKLEIKLEEINFSKRTFNCLRAYKIKTLNELSNLTENDVKKFRNLGKNSISEIKEKMNEYGIQFKKLY